MLAACLLRGSEEAPARAILANATAEDLRASDRSGTCAFIMAASQGMTGLLDAFVEKGQDVNVVNGDGDTALIAAAANERLETVRALLALGVDATIKNAEPRDAEEEPARNALEVAEEFGATEIANVLRAHQQQQEHC